MHLYLATVLTLVLSLHARQFRTATIIATNDIHGVAFPLSLVRSDNNQTYSQGGLSFLAHMIKTVQS
jgi:2',3'-cyclic-nucleotide 2'-phosphodiesterase (5'-nucleotidase family)